MSNKNRPTGAAEDSRKGTSSTSRRAFLGGGLFVGALVFLGGFSWFQRKPEDIVISAIRRNLPEQSLPERDLQDFATNFAAKNKQMRKNEMAVNGLRTIGPIVFSETFQSLLPTHRAQLLAKFEREIVTSFLFSTDFFQQGAQGWENVSYVGYYDPYEHPCGNPLAEFSRPA